MIVVDTNVVAFHVLPGPEQAAARAVFRRDPVWATPHLFRSEIANLLGRRVRRGESPLADALLSLEMALEVVGGREFPVEPAEALRLSAESACTAYDCEFVALSRRLEVPLVTDDRQILRAFPGLAVSMEAFARRG